MYLAASIDTPCPSVAAGSGVETVVVEVVVVPSWVVSVVVVVVVGMFDRRTCTQTR